MTKPILDDERQNEVWNVLGEKIVCKISGLQTFGRFALVEQTSPAAGVVPMHFHRRTDEFIYILEGRYEIRFGEKIIIAKAGETVFIPRGTAHGFRNLAEKASRILAVITPSGFENFFAEISRLSPGQLEDMASVVEVGTRNDLELVM